MVTAVAVCASAFFRRIPTVVFTVLHVIMSLAALPLLAAFILVAPSLRVPVLLPPLLFCFPVQIPI